MPSKYAMAVLGVAAVLFGAAAGTVMAKPAGIVGPVDLPVEGTMFQYRLWIDGVTEPGVYIEVDSFSWGVTQSGDIGGGGGGGAGKASFQDLHITSVISHFSPEIVKECVTGEHIRKVTLEMFSSADKKKGNETIYMKITLQDVLISGYQVGGQGGDMPPMEQISFAFAKITYQWIGTDPALHSSFTYDLKAGKVE